MFSPFPNKQRGQAFSPASSASSPVPTAALAGSFSRQGHPFTPTQNNQGPVTDTRTPVSSAPQVPSAAKPGSKPPKALPLFDPKLRPNIAHWPIPETTSTRPGWAIRWRRYTYAALHTASTASPPDLSHSLQSPVHDVQDAHRPHKRQKTDLQPGDVDAYRFSSPAIWLAACASQSPDGLDAIERARKRVQETIAHIQDAHLGFHQPDAPIVHPPPAIPSSDIEDGEVGELAPSSSSTSTYPSPLVTLNPHSDPPGPATHPGMPARTCFVHTIPSESAVQRHLWIFDLDERACSMSPLPDHFEGLEIVDSGVFTLGDLYPSMVDSTTGYPMILNAHTTPGSLDLAGTELKASLRNASQAFLSSMQSHLTHHLTLASGLAHSQTRLCGQDLLVFPSSEQLAADEEQASVTVAVTPIITYRWEGLVVRASQQVVPWRLLPAHDAKQGASVRLCPMGVEAVIKRTLTVNESGRSSPNRDQSLTSDAKDSFELDHPELVKGLSLNHWVIVSWEGQDVVWPLDLTIQLQPASANAPSLSQTSTREMDPVASSIDELAIQAGQYIDEVIKEREKIKPKLPDTASTPREGASPASTPKLTNDNSPSTNHLDNKTPTATSRTSTTASAKATVTGFDHAPDESQQNATDDATTAFMNMNGTSAPNSKNDSKQNQESMVWSGFGEDTDQDGGAFDDVLSGLTADDFSFFDIPALPNSDPNPGSNIFSNLFDDSNNLSADNLFGEATGGFFASSPQSNFSKSPATQAAPTTQSPDLNTLLPRSGADTHHNGLSLESDVSDQTAASPNFSQLFGMSPATVNSPYKTPFTPFSAEDPTPPPAAAAVFARSNYPGQLPTGPAAASTRIEWDASGLDRFGPLLFKTPISTSIDSRLGIIQLYQDDDTAKKASRSKNKKVKKAARSAFLRPLPFEPGILKRGDRPNLWKPADISIKKPPSLDDSDSDSEFERPTISPITPVLHVVDSLDEKPSPKDSELVLSMHLLALHSFRSLPSCTADGSRCISESALPYPVLAATTLEYLHFCKALAPKALRCDSKTEVPFSHPIIRMPDIEHGSLLALERPRILAARGESVVSADMESLRIWNTLAFKPLSGIKNVMALALADLTLEDVAKECMRTLSIAYTACNLGEHSLFNGGFAPLSRPIIGANYSHLSEAPNLILSRAWLKFIAEEQMHRLLQEGICIVCYTPADLSVEDVVSLKEVLGIHPRSNNLFTYPLSYLQSTNVRPMSPSTGHAIARTVYDSIRRNDQKLDRPLSVSTSPTSPADPTTTPQQMLETFYAAQPGNFAPHFTLSPREYDPVSFSLKWPAPALEVLDRHRFLHLTHGVTPDGKRLAIMICDDRGEMQEKELVALSSDQEQERVGKVWLYLQTHLRKSSVEWRVVITFLHSPSAATLECWRTCLLKVLVDSRMACHFSLVHLQLIASGNHRTVSSLVAAPLSTPHEQGPLSLRPSDVGTVFRHGEDIVLGANLLTHTPHKVCEDSEANCWSLASAFFYPSQGRELERPSPCPAFSAHLLGAFASPTSILERSLYQHMVDLSTSLSDLVHLGRARQYTNNIVPFQAELLSTYYLGI